MKSLLIAFMVVAAATFTVKAAPACTCTDCGFCCPCECTAGCC